MNNYDLWKTTDPAMVREEQEQNAADRVASAVYEEFEKMGLAEDECPPDIRIGKMDAEEFYQPESNARNRAEQELERWFEDLEGPGPYRMSVTRYLRFNRIQRLRWIRTRRGRAEA